MGIKGILVTVSLALSILIGIVIGRGHGGGLGGGETKAANRKLVIGLSLDTLKEERWQRDKANFEAKVQELGGEVRTQSANSDDAVQIQNVSGLLSGGIDCLVIAAHDGKSMAKAVEMAHKSGVPVIAYDRLIMSPDLDVYVSFDAIRVGIMQGKFIVDAAAKSGKKPYKIVRIYGAKTDNNAVLFKDGQDIALKDAIASGAVEVIAEDWAEDWKPENAKRIVSAAITRSGKDIDAILSSNDGMAGGAIQSLSEEGLVNKVLVTGQDAELVACQRIAQGTQTMTIYKPLKTLAETAAEMAMKMAQRKPIIARDTIANSGAQTPALLIDTQTVTKETMRDTIIKDGFHKEKDVYGK